ncbi:HPr family phosphocarrier protein [Microvirga sp. KLBC 81]|uniref:HPr family phosphocarrier protein n=1 Tax=Microvirga sp. KLBC 81 TaxID=1862707 RepID=UPI000D518EBD|nr:HPr family phosphocarrier protein [Microvirga sp. KLBC 81]PVE25067.1 HPr family phosphocarrier protein [Microvirga sp. KLBC 81]
MDQPLDQDCPPSPVPDGAEVRELPIINRRGLHARASAKFVQTVERFDADVTVTRCGETVGGRSIMGLLTLAAAQGTTITVAAKGQDAGACLQAIDDLLANKFGEEE